MMDDALICKICRTEITDIEGALPFMVRGQARFYIHPGCRQAVTKSGELIGTAVRGLVELRKPGFFSQPLVRGLVAAVRELRK